MPLSMCLLFYRCAILMVSFGGIVCWFLDFVIENFAVADIYGEVEVAEPFSQRGQFVLKKDNISNGSLPSVVRFCDILPQTVRQEGNNPKVITFFVKGDYYTNYNIAFKSVNQARYFATHNALPARFTMRYARLYSNVRPVVMTYDELDNGDIGFKLLDNGDYPDLNETLYYRPYRFRRFEIENKIRTRPPQTLYLRNRIRGEDNMIKFKSTDNLGTFLKFFPDREYEDSRTVGYYHMMIYDKHK